jgi:dipeptidyl-peptidase-3
MKFLWPAAALLITFSMGCSTPADNGSATKKADSLATDSFKWEADQFGDTRVLRYQVPGWEQLSLQQKTLAYYLTMAGLSGRDIMWDQNYSRNLEVRKALESVLKNYKGERSGTEWDNFMLYAKQVFFSNGIHHHYGMEKFMPEFPRTYLDSLVAVQAAQRFQRKRRTSSSILPST